MPSTRTIKLYITDDTAALKRAIEAAVDEMFEYEYRIVWEDGSPWKIWGPYTSESEARAEAERFGRRAGGSFPFRIERRAVGEWEEIPND